MNSNTTGAINLFNVASAHKATMKNLDCVDYKFYNSLPLVSESAEQAKQLSAVRDGLLAIIDKHKLGSTISIRLIHKHFEMLPGEVATFATVDVPGICNAIIMGPVKPGPDKTLLGKNFALDSSGNWVAFEFTTDITFGGHIEQFPAFAKEAADYLKNSDGKTVFGLSWEPAKEDGKHYTEFEVADKRSTIMVPSDLFPADKADEIIQTNWSANPTNESDCLKTRNNHYGCKATRSGVHYGARNLVALVKAKDDSADGDPVPEVSPDDTPFWKALQDPTSQFFKIVDHVTALM